ncbi:MAG: hypothetical protein KJ709_00005 [Nanoarchaeota archaeon]|nr:hypothetical protein [Nanoarchaeota archaeon]
MGMKKCNFCENRVPKGGQCNTCGFVDNVQRMPTPEEFERARKVNDEHDYDHFKSIDLLLDK